MFVLTACVAPAQALYVYDDEVFDAGVRLARCGATAACMVASYSWGQRQMHQKVPGVTIQGLHKINADRLKDLFFQNKGIYVKIGQYIGMLDYLVPEPYVAAMRGCFDDAPASTWPEIVHVVESELGDSPHKLFAEFDTNPIASASLAQVHHAVTFDGQEVAVKVQHKHLRRMASTEVAAVDALLRFVRIIRPEFGFQWLVDEMRLNIPKELNFREEAENAERARAILSKFGNRVRVPEILPNLSSERVLTMSYERGAVVSDANAMRQMGLRPRSVARLLSEVFCELIFVSGFVHCDPHPGNVFVRASPEDGGIQIVLLDHGLYRVLPEDVRLDYCELWRSIVLSDSESMRRVTSKMGIQSPWMDKQFPGKDLSHTLIAAMLTAKEWTTIAHQKGLTRFDDPAPRRTQREKLSTNIKNYIFGIMDVLESCPRDLLLILKANDSLRSASNALGALSVDTFLITAATCLRVLMQQNRTGDNGDPEIGGIAGWWARIRARAAIFSAYLRVRGAMLWIDFVTALGDVWETKEMSSP